MKKILFILFYFIVSCSNQDLVVKPPEFTYDYTQTELDLLQVINNYRSSKNLSQLSEIQHISYKCFEHNLYMIDNNVTNHDYFYDRSENIKLVLDATRVGEVIAYNYITNQGVVDAWVSSPRHKSVLEGNWTNFGVSITENSNHRKYITMIFVRI